MRECRIPVQRLFGRYHSQRQAGQQRLIFCTAKVKCWWRAACLFAIVACRAEPAVPRFVVAQGPCSSRNDRATGSLFLASLTQHELAELIARLADAADRLDARMFDADLADGDPGADLRDWLEPRQQAWAAARRLAEQQWGPTDGAFCAHVEISTDRSRPAVWPRTGDSVPDTRLQFVASVLTESVLLPATIPTGAIDHCRRRSLQNDSAIAGVFAPTSQTPQLAEVVDRILRRLPSSPQTLAVREVLSRLRDASAEVPVPATVNGMRLAVARVGVRRGTLVDDLHRCLGEHGESVR